MKKVNIILISALLIILIGMSTVNAASANVTIEGDNKVTVGETKKVTVKVETTATEIGVISGKIKTEGNITIKQVVAKNSWSLTYNDQDGEDKGTFNMVKAAGTKSEEIMEIEYIAGNTEGTGKIILEGINATNINYEKESLGNISKEIKIESVVDDPGEESDDKTKQLSSIKITKAPTKTTYTEGEKFDKTGMVVTANYSDGTSKEITNYTYTPTEALSLENTKITISYTEEGITKVVEQEIKVLKKEETPSGSTDKEKPQEDKKDDGTTSDKKMPDTGVEKVILPIAIILIFTALSYIGYKKYKNI